MIKDIISYNLIKADINDTIYDVSKLMYENNIGFIPIFDKNSILGVVTDRDIVVRGITNNVTNINIIVSTNIISVDINTDIDTILKTFSENKIKRLLITENDKYIGVLSIYDLLKLDNINITNTLKSIFSEESNNPNTKVDDFLL